MRDRDEQGRPRNARSRDALGRPLPPGSAGVPPLPENLDPEPAAVVGLAWSLLDSGLPFQAHEALEAAWKAAPDAQRPAWQGLAQLAVAVTHARRGNARGARRLAQRGRANLAQGELPDVAADLRDRLLALTR
jgi:predicted metal-dependent hydrolase